MHPDEDELRLLLIDGLNGCQVAYRRFMMKLSALLRLYVRHQLIRLRQPDGDFEDIVQEALIAIHSKRHTYEPNLPVTAWAYAITRYKLIDYLRASNRRIQTEPLDEVDGEIDDSDQIEAALVVRKGIAALPSSLRTPLQSMKIDGFSAKDVAQNTGSSEITVRVNVHRALKVLARLFGTERRQRDENQ